MVPDFAPEKVVVKLCVVTITVYGYPYIDTLVDGEIIVAGNGAAVKSSNEIGRFLK